MEAGGARHLGHAAAGLGLGRLGLGRRLPSHPLGVVTLPATGGPEDPVDPADGGLEAGPAGAGRRLEGLLEPTGSSEGQIGAEHGAGRGEEGSGALALLRVLGRTPPWTMVTPARGLFLHGRGFFDGLATETNDSPAGALELPGGSSRPSSRRPAPAGPASSPPSAIPISRYVRLFWACTRHGH